ncbi:MAG: lipid biosynthesis B12-binding/radical SAM protein [Desulfarculaceae bacterium]|nr:lipid biosynthesis B12-binding/radical SAM protein [Desulfarculaceae bacterium]
MKILLIDSNVATSPYPVYPLGMSMVAGALADAGHEVAQFDFLQNDKSFERLRTEIKRENPAIVGISMRNIDNVNLMNEQRYISVVKDIVNEIRSLTDARVVLGGTAFSLLPEDILHHLGADFGIVGEGEKLMTDLADRIENGREPADPVLRAGSCLSGKQMHRALYDGRIMEWYLSSGSLANVQTKRGCPHKCVYCSYPALEGKEIRPRDVKDTVDDIECLVRKHAARMIFFTDSIFNDEEGHYITLLQEMERRNLSVPWTAYIKPGPIEKSVFDLMLKTGVRGVELGSDGATDRTLKALGKSFRFRDIIDCNRAFADNGIATANFFMFGGPGETRETVTQGIDNIIGLKNTVSFMFIGIRILPGTALKNLAVKQSLLDPARSLLDPVYYIDPGLDKDWLEATMEQGFKPYRHCVFPPDTYDKSVKFLHKLGHNGLMWDMLIPGRGRGERRVTSP